MEGKTLTIDGIVMSLSVANTVIVGAGAAGMACAARLVEFWRRRGVKDPHERLVVVTANLKQGASRMSGSDKQTYYKMGTSPTTPDTAVDFARTLTAFGCCHGDNALIEGICSLPSFYHLVEAGVPFPHDELGAFVGYKTDHDPYERATSAGPKTSNFMSECLQAEALRLGVKIIDKHVVVDFLTAGQGADRRIIGLVCIDLARAGDAVVAQASGLCPNNTGGTPVLRVFVAENFVLAAGGPGQIYADTVYPRGQYGIHGAALAAGLEACNLTESQYGLASVKFRWNVSGTYMQVVPRIFSTEADGGDEREFLTEYFDDLPTLATAIFLKGYQWPFDAQRITGHQSSLIDMAVHQETAVRGRRVWMDFLRNPVGRPGWAEFDLSALKPEALGYLQKTAAMQATPLERLRHMNPPAIDIYAENGIDLTRQPLQIALCAQHHNGGFAVNKWWESTVPHTFVIGEMAGTHGVKRPGGSALNAGQVGALRTAEYIAGRYGGDLPDMAKLDGPLRGGLAKVVGQLRELLSKSATAGVTPEAALDEIGRRMTRYGAHLRWRDGASQALADARGQYQQLRREGLRLAAPAMLHTAVVAIQQCLTHVAILYAIDQMLARSAGSRGSHCILDDAGQEMHPGLIDPASPGRSPTASPGRSPATNAPYRIRPENAALRDHILAVRYAPQRAELFECSDQQPRPIPRRDVAFEIAWREFREGGIYNQQDQVAWHGDP